MNTPRDKATMIPIPKPVPPMTQPRGLMSIRPDRDWIKNPPKSPSTDMEVKRESMNMIKGNEEEDETEEEEDEMEEEEEKPKNICTEFTDCMAKEASNFVMHLIDLEKLPRTDVKEMDEYNRSLISFSREAVVRFVGTSPLTAEELKELGDWTCSIWATCKDHWCMKYATSYVWKKPEHHRLAILATVVLCNEARLLLERKDTEMMDMLKGEDMPSLEQLHELLTKTMFERMSVQLTETGMEMLRHSRPVLTIMLNE